MVKAERARLPLRQVSGNGAKNPEQIGKEAGRTEDGEGAALRGISSGTTRPEEVRKARARESETSSRGRRSGSIGGVRGPEWGTWAWNCWPTASTRGGPGAPMGIRAAGETRLKVKLGLSRAAQLW